MDAEIEPKTLNPKTLKCKTLAWVLTLSSPNPALQRHAMHENALLQFATLCWTSRPPPSVQHSVLPIYVYLTIKRLRCCGTVGQTWLMCCQVAFRSMRCGWIQCGMIGCFWCSDLVWYNIAYSEDAAYQNLPGCSQAEVLPRTRNSKRSAELAQPKTSISICNAICGGTQ